VAVQVGRAISRQPPSGRLLPIMKKFAVRFEKSSNGWGAFVPDLPGCVALGFTLEETKTLIREALEQHLGAMRADGDKIPEPSYVEMVEVA
jgi:predicted RNase H-like HicB family nuclease